MKVIYSLASKMKVISSLAYKRDLRHISSVLCTRNSCSLTSLTSCSLNSLTSTPTRKYATDTNSDKPKTMFDLYEKNSQWLGLYERHPLKKETLTRAYLEERRRKEMQKHTPTDVHSIIGAESGVRTETSKRVGAIGIKIGTSVLWTNEGFRHAVTLIQIKDCHVMDAQVSRKDGGSDFVTQMVLGALDLTDEKILAAHSREKMRWYAQRRVSPKQFWARFPVSKDALLLPGTEITARHFIPGQYVHVVGNTIKQGFQGVMKRWGMKGQPASHGQTKTHRKMGATGGGQDPGRVFPGKRMAGHVGGKWRSSPHLKVLRINTKLNVVYVKGHIAGEVGGFVLIKDPVYRRFPGETPFPTYARESDAEEVNEEEDLYEENVARFSEPSLEFPPYSP